MTSTPSSKPVKLYYNGKHFRSTALLLKDGRYMELRRDNKTKWGHGEERTYWPSKEAWNAYVLASDAATTTATNATNATEATASSTPVLVIQEIPKPIKTNADCIQNINNYLQRIETTNGRYNKDAHAIELLHYLSNEASEFMKDHKKFADTVARKCYEFKVDRLSSQKLKDTCDCVLTILNKSLFATPCKVVAGRCGECKHCDILNNDADTEFVKIALNNAHYPCMKHDTSTLDSATSTATTATTATATTATTATATAATATATTAAKVESSTKEVQPVEKIENISILRSYLQTIDSSSGLLAENLCKELVLYLSKPNNLAVLRKLHCFRMEVRARVNIHLKTEVGNKFLSDTDF